MKTLIFFLSLMIGLASAATAQEYDWVIPPGLEDHYLCNALAEYGYRMSRSEIQDCSVNYEWMKSSFMTMTAQEYGELSVHERARLNIENYQKFKQWEEENFHLTESLRVAMSQIAREMIE